MAEGYLPWSRRTYLGGGSPTLVVGVPILAGGKVPTLVSGLGGTCLGQGVPTLAKGYLPWRGGGTHLGRDGVPRRCKQTENITFPHPSDAVSDKTQIEM